MSRGVVALATRLADAVVEGLALTERPLPPELAVASADYRGAPLHLLARAWSSSQVAYARLVTLVGQDLEIGNLVVVPAQDWPLPLFGADLVALSRPDVLLAIDAAPTVAAVREAQLQRFALASAQRGALRPAGEVPPWCQPLFSPHALFVRADHANDVATAAAAMVDGFIELARRCEAAPEHASCVRRAWHHYASTHLTEDKALGLLDRLFGSELGSRLRREMMFPLELFAPLLE